MELAEDVLGELRIEVGRIRPGNPLVDSEALLRLPPEVEGRVRIEAVADWLGANLTDGGGAV